MWTSRTRFLVVILVALAGSALRVAAEPKRDHDITIEDYFTLAYLSECSIAPGGEHVVYAEGRWQQSSNDRRTDLWVVKTGGGEKPARLTHERGGDGNIRWAPDGRQVYFTGTRKKEGATAPPYDGKRQVWRIPVEGGDPLALTRVPGGVDGFDLPRGGEVLYFTTSRTEAGDEWAALRNEFDKVEYGHGDGDITDVHRLDLQSWRVEKVASLKRAVAEYAVSPDGRRIAFVTAPEDKVLSFEGRSAIEVWDTASGKTEVLPDALWRAKAPSPYGRLNSLAWSGDGRSLAFVIAFDGYPSEIMVAHWAEAAPAAPTVFKLDRRPDLTVLGSVDGLLPMRWRGNVPELYYLAAEQGRVRLYRATDVRPGGTSGHHCVTPDDVVIDAFDTDLKGDTVAAIVGGPRSLPDVHLLHEGKDRRRLTDVNPQTANWKWPELSVVSWQGANGEKVEGILEKPAGAQEGQPLPMIVNLHGGPTAMATYQLSYTYFGNTLFPSQGYVVLSPNYRGSLGYGDKFVTDLLGRQNDIEVDDILKGVDAMVAQKVADPDRLGVTGWSHGGYLTNCLVTATGRFKAASSGAGIADMVTQWGTGDEPAYTLVFQRHLPWEDAGGYRRTSPVFKFDKVQTPTIFHVGGNDERCPPAHSRMLYRALREHVKTPTELVVYPDESHGLGKFQSRKAKLSWDVAWFDRYVKRPDARK